MATNKIPEVINDARAYIDGADDLIGVKTIELPSFESPTEDVTGIGVAGTIAAPIQGHFNSMETSLEWQIPTKTSSQLFAGKAISLDVYADIQGFDGAETAYTHDQYHVVVRGRVKNHEPGTVEAQKAMNSKTTIETHYIKIEYAGEVVCEVDKYGYKCVIGGEDILAVVRANIGM
jgi:hypothetical protein